MERRLLTISSVASKFRWTIETCILMSKGFFVRLSAYSANLVESSHPDRGVPTFLLDGHHFILYGLDIIPSAEILLQPNLCCLQLFLDTDLESSVYRRLLFLKLFPESRYFDEIIGRLQIFSNSLCCGDRPYGGCHTWSKVVMSNTETTQTWLPFNALLDDHCDSLVALSDLQASSVHHSSLCHDLVFWFHWERCCNCRRRCCWARARECVGWVLSFLE